MKFVPIHKSKRNSACTQWIWKLSPVRENTHEQGQFLMLTERHCQATVFGYEWVNDGQLGKRMESHKNLQACSYEDITPGGLPSPSQINLVVFLDTCQTRTILKA